MFNMMSVIVLVNWIAHDSSSLSMFHHCIWDHEMIKFEKK